MLTAQVIMAHVIKIRLVRNLFILNYLKNYCNYREPTVNKRAPTNSGIESKIEVLVKLVLKKAIMLRMIIIK